MNVKNSKIPLAIDLDGTLVRSDLLVESICVLIKTKPLIALLMPFWLFKGKAWFKAQIARHTHLSAKLLPVNTDFITYLNTQQNRPKILATASNEKFASNIARHFGFDDYLASTDTVNMAGKTKQQHLVDKYGEGQFDYAGDTATDIPVWQSARNAILVNCDRRLQKKLSKHVNFSQVMDTSDPSLLNYLKAMRVHQWLKNLLIFIPLLVAHRVDDSMAILNTLLAFFAFSLVASSVYILNDLFDLPDDRLHPNKRKRPIASGAIPIKHALFMLPLLLLAAAMVTAITLSWKLALVLGFYYLLTLMYSLFLKTAVLLDVQILAVFYTLRLIAGAAVIQVTPSFWLLAFSMSIFLSLAIAKRYTGLLVRKNAGQKPASRRGYSLEDLPILQAFGIASGYVSVLVLALYVNSAGISGLYSHPIYLWMLCPAVLFWISRVWVTVHRGAMHDDPLIFATTDRASQITAVAMVAATYLAI